MFRTVLIILTVKGSNGGLAYGAISGQSGEGYTFVLQNGTTLLAENLGGSLTNNMAPGVGEGAAATNMELPVATAC
ncbi:MAG: hypothetical protein LH609_04900 [Rudanella sp.]|nr:hypothetical protein [Rudanella sp.]